jgi:hypothetical protein
MNTQSRTTLYVTIIRWIARIWSVLVWAVVLLSVFVPDPHATEPVPAEDWFLLSLWGIAALGLLVAWRWELVGAILTIGTMCLRELAWVILKGGWWLNFLIAWAFIVPPAVLFLLSWRSRTQERGE